MGTGYSRLTLAAVAVFVCSQTGLAATITAVGAIADNAGSEVTEFYSTSFTKTLDADVDNRYGSDGYDMFGVAVNHAPYITPLGLGPGINVVGPFPGYAAVDNTAAAAPHDPKVQLETTTSGPAGVNTKVPVISYQISDASLVPDGFRIGIFTDGLDGNQFSSQEIYVEQTAGVGSGAAQFDTNPIINSTVDMVFFDLTDVMDGDEFTLFVDDGSAGTATLQGVTFDSLQAVPEPSTIAVWTLLGLFSLVYWRRSRK